MKAIKLNGKTYKVQQERGSYVYYIDSNGKTKCCLISEVELIDSEIVEKENVSVKTKKLNKANFMSVEEFRNSKAGRMTQEQWNEYRENKIKDSLQSSLR